MPYYWRPWRRPRRIWRRRARGFIRARWRRRRYRYRNRVRHIKRKLKKITVKEWQPTKIKRLTITGQYPLYEGTNERTGNNNTQYIDSEAPHYVPGGGLYSVTQFTLAGLYELHLKGRNWWTTSNCDLPLIRYCGCKLTLYRSTNTDYVTVYARCGELKVNEQMYQSCQPSILTLNKHKRIVRCLEYSKSKKPFKTLRIKPPTLLQTRWYFQKELANTPLFVLLTSAMSVDRWYINSKATSSTIGFNSLNTDSFKFSDFKKPSQTSGYRPNTDHLLFALTQHTDYRNAKYINLIYLGNTNDYNDGTPLGEVPGTFPNKVDTWLSNKDYWGNPFKPTHFSQDGPLMLVTNQGLETIKTAAKTNNGQNTIVGFTPKSTTNIWECRYNPQNDRGHNTIYLQSITQTGQQWGPPLEPKLKTEGLPLWLLFFGWTDWLEKAKIAQRMWTDYVIVIISDYIVPKKAYYVLIDTDMLNGRSSYMPEDGMIKDYDLINYHPKLNYQRRSINDIIKGGPATAKLPTDISTEAHINYKFYFKLGGCPPPMDNVCNPQTEPTFPRPGNILQPTLLQSPTVPIQYYLYSFDQRRDLLTQKASKRIKTDWGSKENVFTTPGTTAMDINLQTPETTSTSETSDQEEEEASLQQQLRHQRRKQLKLRQRILKLLVQE